jgi:hypothetical protein
VFWKDWQFQSGGWTGFGLRLSAYGALLLVVRLGSQQDQAWFLMADLLCLAASFDLAVQAARMFRSEIEWRTLPMLMLLPAGYVSWAFEKSVACLTVLVPPLLWGFVILMLAPTRFVDHLGELVPACYFALVAVFGLHLVVWLSLLLRHAAVPAAIGLMALGMSLIGLVAMAELACALCGVPVMLIAGTGILQNAIARLVRERAAE